MTLINPAEAAFVVVDMETTGLNIDVDVPLEMGVGVYDINLNQLAINSWLMKPNEWDYILAKNDFVKEMHIKNGLIADLSRLPEKYTIVTSDGKQVSMDYELPTVALQIWEWLTMDCGIEANTLPMTGSSIGSLDRPFMRKYLPLAAGFFTYRSIDISSIKELCKHWNPKLYHEMQMLPPFGDAFIKAHRVRGDIEASVMELKFYMENFLQVQPAEIIKPNPDQDTLF